jgi:glycosyltransferase involved in cell wall biosynthesis
MTRVDVIVPCYNYGDMLEDCVRSILAQDGVDVRVLVMDDASSDATETVGRRLAARNARVEYRRHTENVGNIRTYNEALTYVTGDYCLILSADDLLTPGSLARATRVMDAHPEIGLAYGRDITFRHTAPLDVPVSSSYCGHKIFGYAEFLERACRLGHTPIQAPTAIVRTSLHREIGGYMVELPHAGDTEIWLRMAAHGAVCELDADQAFRRLHANNMSLSFAQLGRFEQQKKAFDAHFARYAAARPEIAPLHAVVNRTIAEAAVWSGAHAFDAGQRDACDRFLRFAAETCPGIETWNVWRRLQWKRLVPAAIWRRLAPLASRSRESTNPEPRTPNLEPRTLNPEPRTPNAELRTPNAKPLHVVVEMNNADLRIGAVNDALDLAELAAPASVRFTIAGPLTEPFEHEADNRGAATLRASSRAFSRREFPLYALDVLRWVARLRRLEADVLHINYASFGPSSACAARILRIPVVGRPGPYLAGNLSNGWIAAYAANCRAHADALLASPLADRVVVTGDLLRLDRLRATRQPIAPLPPTRDGIVRLLFLGQLVERKGIHVLIEAFAKACAGAELLLVGGDWNAPGYPQRLQAMARAASSEPHIRFINHRAEVGALLQTADIFVLPSLSEARPRSVIEAMSAGVPVVASATGGLPSLITHERTGLLVPAGDVDHLAAALNRLIQSASIRKRLGDAGRDAIEQQCRPQRTAHEYVALYRRVVERHPAAASRMTMVANARS